MANYEYERPSAALGFDVTAEDSSSAGRVDMAVRPGGPVCLFEFKVVDEAPSKNGGPSKDSVATGSAMRQLREKGYAEKYRHLGEPIHLIGVEFSRQRRSVASSLSATATPPPPTGFEIEPG